MDVDSAAFAILPTLLKLSNIRVCGLRLGLYNTRSYISRKKHKNHTNKNSK